MQTLKNIYILPSWWHFILHGKTLYSQMFDAVSYDP